MVSYPTPNVSHVPGQSARIIRTNTWYDIIRASSTRYWYALSGVHRGQTYPRQKPFAHTPVPVSLLLLIQLQTLSHTNSTPTAPENESAAHGPRSHSNAASCTSSSSCCTRVVCPRSSPQTYPTAAATYHCCSAPNTGSE